MNAQHVLIGFGCIVALALAALSAATDNIVQALIIDAFATVVVLMCCLIAWMLPDE